ncbi:MAG TPA: archaemetzincin family Zn-dependent metalloprotease [Candidatus Methanoperedenaceae archaeon]|nr:archaemetzincin family Zn-dependent metalloprotease [Candidatus Methanoperedenaceae archaeon]
MNVGIVPVGRIEADVLDSVCKAVGDIYEVCVSVERAHDIPEHSFNRRRNQYVAYDFLKLAESCSCDKNLAVTDADLYLPRLNFVFGQAKLNGRGGVVSLFRLNSSQRDIFILRAMKESVHEMGHLLGLRHCSDPGCVMSFSPEIVGVDKKGVDLCRLCEDRL